MTNEQLDQVNVVGWIPRRVKNALKQFRVWRWRAVAEGCIWLSTIEAKSYLRRNGPITVLVDNSALGHGTTHESVRVDTGTKMWGGRVPIETGYSARVPIHSKDNDGQTYREVTYLIGIAELARAGLIKLVTSAELQAERIRHPIGRFSGYGWDDLNVFEGIQMPSIDGHVLDLKDAKGRQLGRLKASTEEPFTALASLLPASDSLDAWHIHTAHKHRLFGFLTCDFDIIDKMKRLGRKVEALNLHSRPILPSELGAAIGLRPIPSYMISYRGARWAVHPELHVPNQKRSSPGRRKMKVTSEQEGVTVADEITRQAAKEIRGALLSNGHEAIKVQFEDQNGQLCEIAIKLGDAMYLLSLLKSIQLNLDIPFPDDPRDPDAIPVRPSERRKTS